MFFMDVDLYWKKYKENGDKDAREELILEYLSLVKFIINRIAIKLPLYVEKKDLFSFGIIGLVEAIERFDLNHGVKFETYARRRIHGAIVDHFRLEDWVPRTIRAKTRQLQDAMRDLEQKLHRSATETELAEFMGITDEELDGLLFETMPITFLSIQTPLNENSEDQTMTLGDKIEDERMRNPSDELQFQQNKEIISESIEQLPRQERLVLILYYYEELMLKEIGHVLNVSESRVSQIHAKAMIHLRAKLEKAFV